MADRLELEARFKDLASGGVKKLGKTLESVRPSNGMQAAQKWMGEFRSAADKANVAVRPLATGLSAVGIGGLAASLSMGELVKQFKDLADSTLTMRELGRQSRMSATEISRLQYAAGKLHVDPAAVGGAISSWSSKMVEFRMHTSEFYRYLMRQNADVARKIAADSPVDGLKDTLDYISRIKDPQIQKRVADMAGVGDLTPMLGKGPQGLAEAFADAAREVKPISAELQQAADRFNDATNRFNQSWSNLKNDIGPAVLDPLTRAVDKLDEGLKFAAAYPGDAAAAAAAIAGSLAAFWLRARIMRGSRLAGGAGAAGAELAGAAREQVKAGGTLLEAAIELKAAAAELRARGGLPGGGSGGAPGEDPKKPGDGSFDKGRGLLAAFGLAGVVMNAPGMDEAGDHERDANASALESFGKTLKKWTGASWLEGKVDDWRHGTPPTASDKWQAPARYSAEARARDDARGVKVLDGNALRRGDEMPVGPVGGSDLKRDVQEGSKAGIIAGLRELAQQQELGGEAAGNSFGVRSSSGGMGGSGRHVGGAGQAGAGGNFPGASLGDHARGGIGRNAASMAPGARESFDFWKSKGLTSEQAAGLAGMEQGESSFNPRAVGDGGAAHGAFQWHADRRRQIMAGAGIDVDRATHRQQLEAAYWEFQHTEQAAWTAIKRGRSATDAARSGVYLFERPADKHGQSIVRGGMGEGWLKRFTDEDAKKGVPGAGTPAPSAAAVGDAAMFAAKQRLLNGGRDPADRALVDRYKAQQAKPEGHRAGGWIRGPGTGTSDSIPAWLSHGEFVVRAGAAKHWGALLHAINGGHLPAYADGGEVAAGLARHRSWHSFFRRSPKDGGMGAPEHVALGAMAMMMGESGKWLNPKVYNPNDVDGPSGGSAQWHDVTRGRYAGKIRRFSDLMAFAMTQHADWKDPILQQAWFRKEATGSMAYAWNAMRRARTARGALDAGVRRYEVPAHPGLEVLKRMPNIMTLARESGGGRQMETQSMDPLEVTIRHHPHSGAPIVQARAGRGVKLNIRTGPTMRPT